MGELKRTRNKPMRTIGSLSMVKSLMAAGLVDRLRLVVFPVITGVTGRERIYDGYADFMLDMVNSQTFDGRLQLLEYAPTPLTGTRGTAYPPLRNSSTPVERRALHIVVLAHTPASAGAGSSSSTVRGRLVGLSWAHLLNDGASNYLPGVLPAVLTNLD